uniref:Doublecortin domain containing 2C n=1 Tax=Dromaius novaehollandiae TaxID=8790 RepID=A0A8C4KDW7_DRONO
MVASLAPLPGCGRGDLAPARTVLVYLNGDPFYPGKKFVVNRRHVPTFEALLAQLNEAVAAPFGVRALYTPRQGHRLRGLDDLEQGGRYVAAGLERFKKLDILNILHQLMMYDLFFLQIKPVVHSAIRVPSRWQCISNNVFSNGEMIKPPIKFIIPRFTLKNWNCVLALINEKMFLRSGGVHRLYTMDGHAVHSSDGLEDNHFYVAVGRENFKSLPYWRSSRVPSEVRCIIIANWWIIECKNIDKTWLDPLLDTEVYAVSLALTYNGKYSVLLTLFFLSFILNQRLNSVFKCFVLMF